MNKVLVIVAHPDDEIIGVGGTLNKHVNQGDDVQVLILGDGKSSRKTKYKSLDKKTNDLSINETKSALKTLGIKTFHKESLPDNRFDHVDLLDIAKTISKYIQKYCPDIIYTHHYGDLNIDHQLTSEAVIICTRPIEYPQLSELRMCETLSATEMSGPRITHAFLPNLFVNIEIELPTKLKAMSFYKTELREYPHPRSLEAIELNAKLWGSKNNNYAVEPFFIFRKNVT